MAVVQVGLFAHRRIIPDFVLSRRPSLNLTIPDQSRRLRRNHTQLDTASNVPAIVDGARGTLDTPDTFLPADRFPILLCSRDLLVNIGILRLIGSPSRATHSQNSRNFCCHPYPFTRFYFYCLVNHTRNLKIFPSILSEIKNLLGVWEYCFDVQK